MGRGCLYRWLKSRAFKIRFIKKSLNTLPTKICKNEEMNLSNVELEFRYFGSYHQRLDRLYCGQLSNKDQHRTHPHFVGKHWEGATLFSLSQFTKDCFLSLKSYGERRMLGPYNKFTMYSSKFVTSIYVVSDLISGYS